MKKMIEIRETIEEMIETRGTREVKGMVEVIDTKEEIVKKVIEIGQRIAKEVKIDTKITIIPKIIAETIHRQEQTLFLKAILQT